MLVVMRWEVGCRVPVSLHGAVQFSQDCLLPSAHFHLYSDFIETGLCLLFLSCGLLTSWSSIQVRFWPTGILLPSTPMSFLYFLKVLDVLWVSFWETLFCQSDPMMSSSTRPAPQLPLLDWPSYSQQNGSLTSLEFCCLVDVGPVMSISLALWCFLKWIL